jgi:hypothetical protein
MRNPFSRCPSAVPALVIMALATVAAPGTAQAQDPAPLLYACVNNSSGEVKMVGAEATCRGNSTKVNWSIEGPAPGTLSSHSVHERNLDTGDVISAGIFGGLQCPAGKKPLGGGVEIVPALAGYAIVATRPLRPGDFSIPDPQGWFAFVLKIDAQAPFVPVFAKMYVTCARAD